MKKLVLAESSHATIVHGKKSTSCIQALTGMYNNKADFSPSVYITLNQKGLYKIIYQPMWSFKHFELVALLKWHALPQCFKETFTDIYKYFIGKEYEM